MYACVSNLLVLALLSNIMFLNAVISTALYVKTPIHCVAVKSNPIVTRQAPDYLVIGQSVNGNSALSHAPH